MRKEYEQKDRKTNKKKKNIKKKHHWGQKHKKTNNNVLKPNRDGGPSGLKTQQRWRPNGLKRRASISRKNNQKQYINMKTSNTMIMQATLYTIVILKFKFQINQNQRYIKNHKSANNTRDTNKSCQKAH